jgi:hypothetical protein
LFEVSVKIPGDASRVLSSMGYQAQNDLSYRHRRFFFDGRGRRNVKLIPSSRPIDIHIEGDSTSHSLHGFSA